MAIWTAVISVLVLLVSVVGIGYARQQAKAASKQLGLSRDNDRRERLPALDITLIRAEPAPNKSAAYYVRNSGPQDLDRIIIHRPRSDGPDGVVYQVAANGQPFEDSADLGPLGLGQRATFVQCIGVREEVPEMVLRVETRRGSDTWFDWVTLPDPRPVRHLF